MSEEFENSTTQVEHEYGGTSAEGQLNEKGAHYTYLVLG